MPAAANLYSVEALRELEALGTRAAGDGFALMRRAGEAAWRQVLARWPDAQPLLVVCGPGNNGGDGYVLAGQARQSGRAVSVVRLPGHAPRSALARRAADDYLAAGGVVREFTGDLPAAALLVDALFGIGLSTAPDAPAMALVDAINRHPAPVFALDAPSGVVAATGAVPGAAVSADGTLEFIAPKLGLRTGAARDRIGELWLAPLGLDAAAAGVEGACELLQAGDLRRWLPPRRRDSHKGSNGRVLCIGGDHGHGGAILLAAEAALRSGAGLVDVATRPAHVTALLARLPEAMGQALADDTGLPDGALLSAADVVVAGPGLGQGPWGRRLLAQVAAGGKPLVLDADALNLLAAVRPLQTADAVLTPHPGEAARLLGVATAQVQADRLAAVQGIADRHGGTVVLKGAGTLVAAPGRRPWLVDAGNPGMAVGGMGDVLSGVIGALRAQGLDAPEAAACGALLHAAAGDAAAAGGERGLLPSDLMPWLRRLANPELVA